MLAFTSTFNKDNARVNRNCAQIMNAATALNSLIAKICYALIIFLFSQRCNLLKVANSASEEKNKEEDEEDEEKEEEEDNERKKIIKKAET